MRLMGLREKLFTFFSVIYVLLILLFSSTYFVDRPRFAVVAFSMSIIVFALNMGSRYLRRIKGKVLNIISTVLIILSFIIALYFWNEYHLITYERAGSPNVYDRLLGGIGMCLTIAIVFVTSGPPMSLTAIIFILYALFGSYFPGPLKTLRFDLIRIVDFCAANLFRGIFGDLFQTAVTLVAIFLILSTLISKSGGFDIIHYFMSIIVRKQKNLITQIPVVASAFFGMFSGSGAANVAGTGSFTIPLLKRCGLPGKFAGAIEAAASAGGQIMPPIMGVAAFLMAEYLGVPYVRIAVMSVPLALIYFTACGFAVYFITRAYQEQITLTELKLVKKAPSELVIDSVPIVAALSSLIVFMGFVQLDVIYAGFYTVVVTTVTLFVRTLVLYIRKRAVKEGLKNFVVSLLDAVKEASVNIMEIALMLSCIEIIVVILSITGLALKLSIGLTSLAATSFWAALFIVAIVCIILGCVVSTVAVYVLAVVTVIPALLRIGLNPFIAHFYAFWYAIAGLITPPVAGNVAVASKIAGSGFYSTAKEAIKIGLGLLIVPLLLVEHPELLLYDVFKTPIAFMVGLVLSLFIAVTFYGKVLRYQLGKVGYVIRVICGIGCLSLLLPFDTMSKGIIAGSLLLGYIIIIKLKSKKNA